MSIEKAKILKVGTVVLDLFGGNLISGWAFDCLGIIPMIEIQENGSILIAGYSIRELKQLADSCFVPHYEFNFSLN